MVVVLLKWCIKIDLFPISYVIECNIGQNNAEIGSSIDITD